MRIAPASIEDVHGIATVHVRSWQAAYVDVLSAAFLGALSIERRAAQWREILQKQESRTLVAHQADGIAGFVSFGHWRDHPADTRRGEIWALYARPEAWGSGVGRALTDAAVRELRAQGRETVLLWVLSRNVRGVRFYESFGFQAVPGTSRLFELGGAQVEETCLRLGHEA